jgi:hypothetical protein
VEQGAHRVIVGTSAFTGNGVIHALLAEVPRLGRARALIVGGGFQGRKNRGQGLAGGHQSFRGGVLQGLSHTVRAFCARNVDKEGMMQGRISMVSTPARCDVARAHRGGRELRR